MESCPDGQYVTSYNTKFHVWIEEYKSDDDTALNGIRLICSDATNMELTRQYSQVHNYLMMDMIIILLVQFGRK
jgi:hypothetical protein